MKVVCINSKPIKEHHPINYYLKFLKEGETYTVEYFDPPAAYKIDGIDKLPCHSWMTGVPSFLTCRFIPCSDIDETELINTELVEAHA